MNLHQPAPLPASPVVRWTHSPRVFWTILIITWLACTVFLVVHAVLECRRLGVASDCWLPDTEVSGYCWGKATGHAPGTPRQILPGNFVDGYLWTRNAQYMYENGIARLRWVPFDNAPKGREVHWHSGLGWMLIAQGYLYHWVYGAPVTEGIERTAPGVNLLPLLACLVFFSWVTARRMGPWAGVLVAFCMIAASVFFENFMFGNPDHHGLFDLGALGCLLMPLIAGLGWLRQPGATVQSDAAICLYEHAYEARRWFIVSAVFGAYGLWVSATFQAMVLALTAPAVFAANAFFMYGSRGKDDGIRYDPTLWRVWGIAGAISSLFFFVLEYCPSHMSMRLEVNHPLYAISWLGGGELICQLTRWQVHRTFFRTWRDVVLPPLALVAAMALPIGVWIGGPDWYTPSHPFMWRLHRYIEEFAPLWWRAEFFQPVTALQVFGIFPLLPLLAAGLCCWRSVYKIERALLTFATIPGVFCMGFAVYQGRWYQAGMIGLLLVLMVCGATVLALVRRTDRFSITPLFVSVAAPLVVATAACIGISLFIAVFGDASSPPGGANRSLTAESLLQALRAGALLLFEVGAILGLIVLRRMTLPRVAPVLLTIATFFLVPVGGALLLAIYRGLWIQLPWIGLAFAAVALVSAAVWSAFTLEHRIPTTALLALHGAIICVTVIALITTIVSGTFLQALAVGLVLLVEAATAAALAGIVMIRRPADQPLAAWFFEALALLTMVGVGSAIDSQQWMWFSLAAVVLLVQRGLLWRQVADDRDNSLQIASVFLLVVMVTMSVFPVLLLTREYNAYTRNELQIDFLEYVVMRDIGSRLRDRYGAENLVILSSPSDSLPMSYFSDGRAIGTLYWENLEGLRAAAAMYASHSDEEVRQMMRERGVTHFVTVSRRDFVGGYYELDKGQFDENGLKQCFAYRLFVERKIPNWLRPMPLGYLLDPRLGQHVSAVFVFEVALDQDESDCHFHLGNFYADMKRPTDALSAWARAIQLRPDRLDIVPRMVRAILQGGETQKASQLFANLTQKAKPEAVAPIRVEVAECFANVGALPQAIEQYRLALQANANDVRALNNLAWIYATSSYGQFRNGPQAVQMAEQAVQIGGKEDRALLSTLAAAYAEAGRFADAVKTTQQALALAEKANDEAAIKRFQTRLELYQKNRPYRD